MIRKKITTFILALLIVSFFIGAATLAIFFAQGQKFNGAEGLVLSSIIRLNSIPSNVTVYVNDKKVDLSDGKIENLDPGLATVRVEKDGYTTWEKTVTLISGVIKDINVQLFPKDLNLSLLVETNINKAVFSKDSDYIYYSVLNTTNETELGIWRLKLSKNLLNLSENKPEQLVKLDKETSRTLMNSDYNIVVSNDNSKLFIYSKQLRKFNVFDINSGQEIDIQNGLLSFPSRVDWFNGSSSLIIESNNLVYDYDLSSKQQTIVTFGDNDSPVYGVANSNVIYYRKSESQFYIYKNKTSVPLKYVSTNLNKIVPAKILTSDTSSGVLAVLSVDKKFWFFDNNKQYESMYNNVDEVLNFSTLLNTYIVRSGNKLQSIFYELTADTKSYDSSLKILDIDSNEVEYSTILENSSSIAFIRQLGANIRTLSILDKDGENRRDLFKDERLTNNPIAISSNGSELYLVLNEKSGQDTVGSLYKLILFQ